MGYTFQSALLSKMRLSSLRVYLNGQNLFTAKHEKLFDPENFNGGVTNAASRGVSHSPYPSAKIYSFGLNIGL
jgi:hypothetical protein